MGRKKKNLDIESPRKGDLVRWISDYNLLTADSTGNVWPHNPVYEFGIVMDVSEVDPWSVVIYSTSVGIWFTAQIFHDDIEIVSRAPKKIIIPSVTEVKKYEK